MIHDQSIRTIKFSHLMQLQRPVALRFINLSRNTQKIVGILPYSPLHLIAEDEPSIERRYTLVILPPRTRRRKISNSTDALSPSQAPIFFFFTSEQRSTSPPASFSNPVRRVAPAHRQCSSERGREFVASLHDVDSAQGSGGYFDF